MIYVVGSPVFRYTQGVARVAHGIWERPAWSRQFQRTTSNFLSPTVVGFGFGKVYSVLFAVRSTSQQSPACYSALSRFAFWKGNMYLVPAKPPRSWRCYSISDWEHVALCAKEQPTLVTWCPLVTHDVSRTMIVLLTLGRGFTTIDRGVTPSDE